MTENVALPQEWPSVSGWLSVIKESGRGWECNGEYQLSPWFDHWIRISQSPLAIIYFVNLLPLLMSHTAPGIVMEGCLWDDRGSDVALGWKRGFSLGTIAQKSMVQVIITNFIWFDIFSEILTRVLGVSAPQHPRAHPKVYVYFRGGGEKGLLNRTG